MKPFSKLSLLVLCVFLLAGFKSAKNTNKKKQTVLIFSLTKGFHHNSIADGITAIKKLGMENGFEVDTTTDVNLFTIENLKKYKTLIFLSPTGNNLFNDTQKSDFKKLE